MKLKSSAFANGQQIPEIYSCYGDNINPPLEISDVPPNAQSLALIMDDPDAPGGTFDHWFIWNIPPTTTEIPQGLLPEGAMEGLNGVRKVGYTGPCPPSGIHRYFFKLYALNKKLDATPNIPKEELEREINDSIIEKTELIGLYSR